MRALQNVMGLHRGDVADVWPTARVEVFVENGHLEWLEDEWPNAAPSE